MKGTCPWCRRLVVKIWYETEEGHRFLRKECPLHGAVDRVRLTEVKDDLERWVEK